MTPRKVRMFPKRRFLACANSFIASVWKARPNSMSSGLRARIAAAFAPSFCLSTMSLSSSTKATICSTGSRRVPSHHRYSADSRHRRIQHRQVKRKKRSGSSLSCQSHFLMVELSWNHAYQKECLAWKCIIHSKLPGIISSRTPNVIRTPQGGKDACTSFHKSGQLRHLGER